VGKAKGAGRARKRALGASIVLATVFSCLSVGCTSSDDKKAYVDGEGDLQIVASPAAITSFADGTDVFFAEPKLFNQGAVAITIETIEPGDPSNFDVIDTTIVMLDGSKEVQAFNIGASLPSAYSAAAHPVRGFVVEPSEEQADLPQVVFHLRVVDPDARATFDTIRITYNTEGERHVLESQHALTICPGTFNGSDPCV
jgi:hypothetical protein